MFFGKKGKNNNIKTRDFTHTNTTQVKPAEEEPEEELKDTLYFYFQGGDELYSPQNKTSAFMELAELITYKNGYIPNKDFFNTEQEAFEDAKKNFPEATISIFKLVIPLEKLHLRNLDGLEVARPNIAKYVESVKTVSVKDNAEEALQHAKINKKYIQDGQIVFATQARMRSVITPPTLKTIKETNSKEQEPQETPRIKRSSF